MKRTIQFLIFPLLGALVYYALNEAKFGTPFDQTVNLWFARDALVGLPNYGAFSLRFLPYSLYTAIFMAPQFKWDWPYLRAIPYGQSLLTTSPALLLALRPQIRETFMLWVAVVLSMGGALCFYTNGYVQESARFWILAFPFLLAIIAKGPEDQIAKILILASIASTLYFTWEIRTMGWAWAWK